MFHAEVVSDFQILQPQYSIFLVRLNVHPMEARVTGLVPTVTVFAAYVSFCSFLLFALQHYVSGKLNHNNFSHHKLRCTIQPKLHLL